MSCFDVMSDNKQKLRYHVFRKLHYPWMSRVSEGVKDSALRDKTNNGCELK